MADQTRVDEESRETVDPAVTLEVAAWVGRLVRTLKTCRLYDEANPTVVRFREDLATSLTAFLSGRDGLRLDVGSSTLSHSGQIVQIARSREDNLAGVLHRDGIRSLTIASGIDASELDTLVDLLLKVTSPAGGVSRCTAGDPGCYPFAPQHAMFQEISGCAWPTSL